MAPSHDPKWVPSEMPDRVHRAINLKTTSLSSTAYIQAIARSSPTPHPMSASSQEGTCYHGLTPFGILPFVCKLSPATASPVSGVQLGTTHSHAAPAPLLLPWEGVLGPQPFPANHMGSLATLS